MRKYSRPLTLLYSIGPVLIITSHLGAFLLLITGLSWQGLLWAIGLYAIRMLGITAIYHRLIIHKSYQTPAWVKWVGSMIACSAGQMGPNWWKGHHLKGHHNVSDHAGDSHSPLYPFSGGLRGFMWSQMGWLLSPHFFPPHLPADVEADPVLKMMDRLHFIPLMSLGFLSYWVGGLEFLGAFFLSTAVLFHGVATVNSLAHLFGHQPFATDDYSRNNWFVALITFGEGWHNMHHAFQWSARHGYTLKNGQVVRLIDPTYGFICLLEMLHLATDIKLPTDEELRQHQRRANPLSPVSVPVAVSLLLTGSKKQ